MTEPTGNEEPRHDASGADEPFHKFAKEPTGNKEPGWLNWASCLRVLGLLLLGLLVLVGGCMALLYFGK
jgi:hypothetical protein